MRRAQDQDFSAEIRVAINQLAQILRHTLTPPSRDEKVHQTRMSKTPWRDTVPLNDPSNSPKSFCRHKSRTRCLPVKPKSDHFTSTFAGSAPRLNNPTALEPSAISLAQTSSSPDFATRAA